MKILIAGGNGFIGEALRQYFSNHEVRILTRRATQPWHIAWDGRTAGAWMDELNHCNVLINLAGKSVDCRYTEANKKAILASRLDATRILQMAVAQATHPPAVWLNASSATIYSDSYTHLNTEANGIIGNDFSMGVCRQWEAALFEQPTAGVRKVAMRISIVLGKDGGAWPRFHALAKWGLGGVQGHGRQQMSWVHMHDLCRAIAHIIATPSLTGVVNITAPSPLTNHRFMEIIREKVRVPWGLPSPRWLLEIATFVMRTETELLLKSRYVYPDKLLQSGFRFSYDSLEKAVLQLG